MRKPSTNFWGILILTTVLFFVTPPIARASQVTISPFIKIPGLTLDTPYPFSQPDSANEFTTLNFDTSALVLSNLPINPLQDLIAPPLVIESTSSASPTPTPTPRVTPVKPPHLTPAPIAVSTPAPSLPAGFSTPIPSSSAVSLSTPGGLNADVLFNMVNDYRKSLNLPAFEKDDKSCNLAASRAPEVGAEIANGNMHQGLRDRNLPYWNTENIITMRTEREAFNWWINDYIHKKAIEGDYKYSCLACSGDSCAEEFTNYQPK